MIDAGAIVWSHRVSGAQYFRAMGIIQSAPPLLQDALAERYAIIAESERRFYINATGRVADTYNDADIDLRRIGRELRAVRPETAFDDDEIEAAARRAAHHCMSETTANACEYARAQGVRLPSGPRVTQKSLRRRLVCQDWWRRRLRVILTRQCEELFRRLGFVRRQTSAYISGDALARIRAAATKARRWMSETVAVCEDTGEVVPLDQIAARSLSNPALRRGELMLRARGFQEIAESIGHQCLMITLTCPSAFHPWLQSGEPNPRYQGASPREAQRWLNQHWARARAAFKRAKLLYYGFRAAEPHHDATPHWHVVLYASAVDVEKIREITTRVWLKDFADEPGAAEHRVVCKDENPALGSGAAYLAKYVAKNIDGAGEIGAEASDESGRPIAEDCQRAVAWARLHGIRQFQQLGGPAVTLWRELRRVREPCEWPPLEALRLTTDGEPSWSAFIDALGGITECGPASRLLWDKAEPRCRDSAGRTVIRLTRWGEIPAPMIIGLCVVWRDRIRRLPTHVHIWFLVFSPLGPVAITVLGARYGSPTEWTNPRETSQAPP
jgi:Bacteriophage replication gene A protein (GPA)